jgi:hypothetical protein
MSYRIQQSKNGIGSELIGCSSAVLGNASFKLVTKFIGKLFSTSINLSILYWANVHKININY